MAMMERRTETPWNICVPFDFVDFGYDESKDQAIEQLRSIAEGLATRLDVTLPVTDPEIIEGPGINCLARWSWYE
jgi:hypothetical protein